MRPGRYNRPLPSTPSFPQHITTHSQLLKLRRFNSMIGIKTARRTETGYNGKKNDFTASAYPAPCHASILRIIMLMVHRWIL
ncbi:hypothetical protein RRG08_027613 [Elysia crispata]|uniref:Uncharacterized protein n=1 Tax=Elysia crispata TaxID=231223 RepID=A0AAE1AH59_9GAST|nr:hypothetical protein RRG08_027613 [Elysia crispata]